MSISGNMVGMYSTIGKTLVLVDADGTELTGVITENVQVFDATPADVRIGKTFASDEGVAQGENTITYRTCQGVRYVLAGKEFSLPLDLHDQYDYEKLQCIIAKYSENVDERMAAEKIVLDDNVYDVGSSVVVSTLTKNSTSKSIDLNITNNTSDIYLIYFFTYKEEAF